MIYETQTNIQFILDGNVVIIDFAKDGLSPTLTVLNYLRSLPGHSGVKEGCAEGDCGACTVVVARIENDQLVYQAVNSCLIFLPFLNGKELITVENLAITSDKGKILHPVQQAMVDQNASQCGYCTPGIVMSIFALTKNDLSPSRENIQDTLTGNLCRCTGYHSIVKAVEQLNSSIEDQFSVEKKSTDELLRMIRKTSKSLAVILPRQKYFKPLSLPEALALRKTYPEALLTNGSTDLALLQTKKFQNLPALIDISDIDALNFFKESDTAFLFGAGLCLETLKKKIDGKFPAMTDLLNVFASKQIREVATLGGNIGTASPIGDLIPLLMASRAILRLENDNRLREMEMEQFITGYRETALQPDEIIHSVFVPKLKDEKIKFYKVSKRKHLDISTVSAGFRLKLKDGKVADICLAFGGMAATPKRANAAEEILLGVEWNAENVEKAGIILQNEFDPVSDARAHAAFRKMVVKNLLTKFYIESSHESTSTR